MLAWLRRLFRRERGWTEDDLRCWFEPMFNMGFDERFIDLTADKPLGFGPVRRTVDLRRDASGFRWKATVSGGPCVLVRHEKRHEFSADFREIGEAFRIEGEKAAEAFVALFRIDAQTPG